MPWAGTSSTQQHARDPTETKSRKSCSRARHGACRTDGAGEGLATDGKRKQTDGWPAYQEGVRYEQVPKFSLPDELRLSATSEAPRPNRTWRW